MITWVERGKAAISEKVLSVTVNTDETAVSRLQAVLAVPTEGVSAIPERLSSVMAVPSLAVLKKTDASIAVTEDLDRWCWPHPSAMNGSEIDTFTERLHQFTDKGLARNDGEALADKLVLRDREKDDRRTCLECRYLAGHGSVSWSCSNWQAAGIAIRSHDAQLPADFVVQLQRCHGFTT